MLGTKLRPAAGGPSSRSLGTRQALPGPVSFASRPVYVRAPQRGPTRSMRRSRTAALAPQANLFSRISRLITSTINNLLYQAEDPEKLLDTVLNEMQEDLIKMRLASAQVTATKRQMEAKYKTAQNAADEWLRRAELAVRKGEDDLAKEALVRRKGLQEQANGLKVQMDLSAKAADQVNGNARVLEVKLSEAKSKKDTLKARAASAKTTKQIQDMISSLPSSSSAVAAFEKMEQKVITMEAETESTALLAGNDSLESKFALLEGGSADDELAALKRGIRAEDKAPVEPRKTPTLPAGRPFKDAFDMELDELRQRAKQ